jgi:hypothetical protein
MEYEFEEYKDWGGRIVPTINLNAHAFTISAGFTKKYDLQGVIGIKLFFDKKKSAVAFKFLKTPEEGMSKIKLEPKQGGGSINSKGFFVKYAIDPKKYQGRYSPEELSTPHGNLFVIVLKEQASEKKN